MCYPSWFVDFSGSCWDVLAVIQRHCCLLNVVILSDVVAFPSGPETWYWHCYFGKQRTCSECLSKSFHSNGRALFLAGLATAFINVLEDNLGPPGGYALIVMSHIWKLLGCLATFPLALSLGLHQVAALAVIPKSYQWGSKYSYLSFFLLAGWHRPSRCLSHHGRKAHIGMRLSPWSLI